MASLFTPLKIRDVEFKNRITVSPMCQYSSQDGFANKWHEIHLGSRAVGGAGLVMTEATAISPVGRITPADLGIWKDDHINNLKSITEFIHQQGAVAGIQLAHAGRKASKTEPWNGDRYIKSGEGGWQTYAPSPVPFAKDDETPIEMSSGDIQKTIEDFKTAARRALIAGFKIAEIHAAHGYLIHEFLSPLSNKRDDEYGGSFENRIRFLLEITKEIRTIWPESLPLFVRVSASDWTEEGWQLKDAVELAIRLKSLGVDLIDCSSGGNIKGIKIPVRASYQVPFAEAIKKEAAILTGAVGMITTPRQAEDIIKNGQADLVFFAREVLRDPYFPLRAARELGVDISWPIQYERAKAI